MSAPEVKFAALTDVGRVRDQNEDNFLVDKKLGLFIVCDGMGGHAAGEIASALAVRTVHEEIKKQGDLIQDY
ncbi:MAG TPA: phosphoprotein phosphatase, partial [Polyangiaceae bacterium]